MASKQYKKLGCLDVDPKGGCAFEVRAETDDEVMRLIADHARHMHKMANPPAEMVTKLRSTIKTVAVNV
jgi:predicted small metal-binding protein